MVPCGANIPERNFSEKTTLKIVSLIFIASLPTIFIVEEY